MKITVPIFMWFRERNKQTGQMKCVEKLINMNWYRNAHFQVLNKIKKEYHELVQKQLFGNSEILIAPLHIHYKIYAKRKGTDGGNIRSVIEKFVLDALIECKVLEDDTIDFIISDSAEYYYDKENPRCEIFLKK